MNTKRMLIFLLALSVSPTVFGQVWHLEPCPQDRHAAYKATRDHLTHLAPGERGYRPKPFPTTKEEVIENFLAYHRQAYSDMAFDQLRPDDQRFFSVVDSGRAEYEMRRIANWTPTRCKERERQGYYFLVQVRDSSTGTEITRFVVDEEGEVAGVLHRYMDPDPANDIPPIPGIATAFGIMDDTGTPAKIRNVQYVTAWGSVDCTIFEPCIAFQSAGRTFILAEGNLFELELDRGTLRVRDTMGSPQAKQRFFRSLDARNERFVSIGGGQLVYISPVEP